MKIGSPVCEWIDFKKIKEIGQSVFLTKKVNTKTCKSFYKKEKEVAYFSTYYTRKALAGKVTATESNTLSGNPSFITLSHGQEEQLQGFWRQNGRQINDYFSYVTVTLDPRDVSRAYLKIKINKTN